MDLNAPGLFSCFGGSSARHSFAGFLALYLFAAAIGSRLRQKGSQLRFLVASAACAAGAYACLARFVQPASRRMVGAVGGAELECNASFVLLVLLIALVILTVAYAINAFVGSFHVPILLDAFNRNQLTVFIVVGVAVMWHGVGQCADGRGEHDGEDAADEQPDGNGNSGDVRERERNEE